MLDQNECVIEGTQSNIFLVRNDVLVTPDLSRCGVAGVMREYILSVVATELKLATKIGEVTLADLQQADEVFLSNSIMGVIPVHQFGDTEYQPATQTPRILDYLIAHEVVSSV